MAEARGEMLQEVTGEMVEIARNMDTWVMGECHRCGEEEDASGLRWLDEAKMFVCFRCLKYVKGSNPDLLWWHRISLAKALKG